MSKYSEVKEFVARQNDKDYNASCRCSYNCMGWALNIKQWLRPLDTYDMWDYDCVERDDFINNLLDDYCNDDDAVREYFESLEVDALIDVWGLRFATQEEINNEAVTLIAFREKIDFGYDSGSERYYVSDSDFHFRKRINGVWTEKMGGTKIRVCEDDIDSDEWCGGYDGDIYYFVKEL